MSVINVAFTTTSSLERVNKCNNQMTSKQPGVIGCSLLKYYDEPGTTNILSWDLTKYITGQF